MSGRYAVNVVVGPCGEEEAEAFLDALVDAASALPDALGAAFTFAPYEDDTDIKQAHALHAKGYSHGAIARKMSVPLARARQLVAAIPSAKDEMNDDRR